MRCLLVGDLHIQIGNLDDSQLLFDNLALIVQSESPDVVIFMGDIYHTHAVLRQEVIQLVRNNISRFRSISGNLPVCLVGNHDMVGPSRNDIDALSLTISDKAYIVAKKASVLFDRLIVAPYYPDSQSFVSDVNELHSGNTNANILLCHQTFDGAQYENGFFAPDGIDQNLLHIPHILTGHIHNKSNIGKVINIGTPRQLISSEANTAKMVVMLDTSTMDLKEYDVSGGLKKFYSMELREGESTDKLNAFMVNKSSKDDIRVSVFGTEEFYKQIVETEGSKFPSIKWIPKVFQSVNLQINLEADNNISKSLHKYLFDISNINPDLKDRVWTHLKQMIPQLGDSSTSLQN